MKQKVKQTIHHEQQKYPRKGSDTAEQSWLNSQVWKSDPFQTQACSRYQKFYCAYYDYTSKDLRNPCRFLLHMHVHHINLQNSLISLICHLGPLLVAISIRQDVFAQRNLQTMDKTEGHTHAYWGEISDQATLIVDAEEVSVWKPLSRWFSSFGAESIMRTLYTEGDTCLRVSGKGWWVETCMQCLVAPSTMSGEKVKRSASPELAAGSAGKCLKNDLLSFCKSGHRHGTKWVTQSGTVCQSCFSIILNNTDMYCKVSSHGDSKRA